MEGAAGQEGEERKQSTWTWVIPLLILGLLVLLFFVWPAFNTFATEAYSVLLSGEQARVSAWVGQFGAWGVVVILGLMLAQSLLAAIPSLLIMIVAVLSYGPVWGGLLAWGGLLVAATMAYVIGRMLGETVVERLVGAKTERKIDRFLQHYGVWAIIAARISPALSTDAVSYAAGIVGMKYLRFITATAVGTAPLAVLVAYLGSDVQRLQTGMLWVSIGSLVIFLGYVIYDRRQRSDDEQEVPNYSSNA